MALKNLYGNKETIVEKQQNRYSILKDIFNRKFGELESHFFSAPGRTEIGGNHTDHNHGRVLAGSVNLDSIAIAAKNFDNQIVIYSENYDTSFVVDLSELNVVQEEEGTTNALIRGIAARFNQLGFETGGFNACITSEVLPGSGLSSSASIEVLIGSIFNALYNNNNIPPEKLAMIGQYAENEYFGKPCGLMDQMACAVGGIISIDFENPQNPHIEKVDFDFEGYGYNLLVVDTGGNHADLTEDYASVPREMKSVAEALSAKICREIGYDNLLKEIKSLRAKVGDRAVLRALHFLGDNERVVHQVKALENGDIKYFLELVNESGNSSFKRLQNIYTTQNVHEQGVSLALALTEDFISGIGEGACRVHGGGFAGTIQVFLPSGAVENYVRLIEAVFGERKVMVLNIRPYGTVYLNELDS
jgi:galactokinase